MKRILLRLAAIQLEMEELAKRPEANRPDDRREWLLRTQPLLEEKLRLERALRHVRSILCEFAHDAIVESIERAQTGQEHKSLESAKLAEHVLGSLYSESGADIDAILGRLESSVYSFSPGRADRLKILLTNVRTVESSALECKPVS
jgi:hypothetical protein